MILLIYLKISIVLAIIFYCGLNLFRRATEERRAEIVIPSGMVIGIAIYIFLLNLVAHFIKGSPGFYFALIIVLALTLFVKTFSRAESLVFPVGRLKTIWTTSLLFWTIFLFIITSTGHAISGDASTHYILASLFARGDYPIHSPFQPDFIAYYHFGAAELLGAFKTITGASYLLLFSLFSFISLLSISQIFTFILKLDPKQKFSVILSFLIPTVAVISLGGFMIAWPFVWELPDIKGNLIWWLGQLPFFDAFGAATSLDSFSLFIHRMLTTAFVVGLLPLILYPKTQFNKLTFILIALALAAIALTDESIFMIFAPIILIFTFFYHFKRSFLKWFIFCLFVVMLVTLQGGFITEAVFNKDKNSQILIFPADETGPSAPFGQYRSYRLKSIQNMTFADRDSYRPFRFFHQGIIWQLSILLILSVIVYLRQSKNKESQDLTKLLFFFFTAAICSLFMFEAFVPKGVYHINGGRFLAQSFHLIGLGFAFFIYYWWTSIKVKIPLLKFVNTIAKIALIWILFFSITPPLMHLFPRSKYNWFAHIQEEVPLYAWIRKNIPLDKRIIMLTDVFPSASSNTDLVTNAGTLTPVWTSEYLATGFDTNPVYTDLFYTINPELLKTLKVDYIIVGERYLSELSKVAPERISDLKNPLFFQKITFDHYSRSEVLRVLSEYLSEGENLRGTFYELRNIAPKNGSYFMEGYPNIDFGFHRSAQLALYDREVYYDSNKAPLYAFVIDVTLQHYGEHEGPYDYLVLGKNTDPRTICNCNPELLWEGLGTGVKLWKVSL